MIIIICSKTKTGCKVSDIFWENNRRV